MFGREWPTFWPVVRRLRSCWAALTAMVGPGKADGWEPLFADDPRFADEAYEVVLATTRSVN